MERGLIAVDPHQGRKVFTLQTLPGCEEPFDQRVGTLAGFSLHAGLGIGEEWAAAIEKVLYTAYTPNHNCGLGLFLAHDRAGKRTLKNCIFVCRLMKRSNSLLIRLYRILRMIGIVLTLVGGIGLMLGFIGFINFDMFALGISAGVRVVGTLAIMGCLLGAIGCFGLEVSNIPS